ncbi:MAG: hypothetical protein JW751_20830 [Polyangiaceae bacterium]|nr:hypothetical protein [Polyangiaceae bacterium]
MRRWLRVRRRVPDTTLRDALLRIEPDHTRRALRSLVRAAQRRRAFTTEGLPIGVVSFDGKHISIPSADDGYVPIPAPTNEVGIFPSPQAPASSR